jgi:K+-sensing histidine kinase KdpD
LQNAFKYTRPGGLVSLRTRTKADRIFIEVEDECGGLPPGKAEELFRPFERRGTDDTGLGLAISRKSVGANGGEIHVEECFAHASWRGCLRRLFEHPDLAAGGRERDTPSLSAGAPHPPRLA